MPDDEYLYHTTPLHYLPHILNDGALYAQGVLAAKSIAPRATAVRRARMLGLTDWVHLSLHPHSPLLADKMSKGYSHALLVFHREPVLAQPEIALLPYNVKAWRTRAACRPVTDAAEKEALLRRHAERGRYPSLEVLAHYGLSLTHLAQIGFFSDPEREEVAALADTLGLGLSAPLITDPALFPRHSAPAETTGESVFSYFGACIRAGMLLPPPAIPFD